MRMAIQAIPAMMVAANTLLDIPAEGTLVVAAVVTPAAAAAVTAKDQPQARQQKARFRAGLFLCVAPRLANARRQLRHR
jgi:hypothetical protein